MISRYPICFRVSHERTTARDIQDRNFENDRPVLGEVRPRYSWLGRLGVEIPGSSIRVNPRSVSIRFVSLLDLCELSLLSFSKVRRGKRWTEKRKPVSQTAWRGSLIRRYNWLRGCSNSAGSNSRDSSSSFHSLLVTILKRNCCHAICHVTSSRLTRWIVFHLFFCMWIWDIGEPSRCYDLHIYIQKKYGGLTKP